MEFFRGHGSAAQEIPRLLYAIADAGEVLERYLLDCSRMLLGAEFVFYDYTRGEFSFLYYPEDPEEPSGPAFYEYLADQADPQDKMLYYTLLRLISISANRTFVLEEGFLERALGRKRPQDPPLAAEQGMEMAGGVNGYGDHSARSGKMDTASVGAGRITGEYRQMRGMAGSADTGLDGQPWDAPAADELDHPEEAEEIDAVQEMPAHSRHLGLFIVGAVIFLAGAIGLACARFYLPMNATYELAARIGMMVCLGVSIVISVYGTYKGLRSSRQELRSVRDHARWERRNALTPVDGF